VASKPKPDLEQMDSLYGEDPDEVARTLVNTPPSVEDDEAESECECESEEEQLDSSS
jgi:hypothetical protein